MKHEAGAPEDGREQPGEGSHSSRYWVKTSVFSPAATIEPHSSCRRRNFALSFGTYRPSPL
ncbi:hypothetical protein OV079_51285 [Nannocystis pusilla]|uniref:Uncharacterized protein n=1 Tax=Nannocystis pusilla TaxID=889268 RepID=A0A9X3F9B8_9BACT|nr:hypothetical protein [Nannocystis pusilla]MCY1013776.1 hypothetical protein [Nannocystis pusilla]